MAEYKKRNELMDTVRDERREEAVRQYTDVELSKFHEQMQNYRDDKKHWKEDRMIEAYDVERYLLDRGAINVVDGQWRVILVGDSDIPYEVQNNKLTQWSFWRDRISKGKKRRDAQFAIMEEKGALTAKLSIGESMVS